MSDLARKSSPEPRAWVTGLGAVSPAGVCADDLWKAALDGRSLLSQSDDGFCLGPVPESAKQELRDRYANDAIIQTLKANHPDYSIYDAHYFTLAAMREAMAEAGWNELREDDGIIFATTTGQVPVWEKDLMSFLRDELDEEGLAKTFRHQTLGITLQQLAIASGFEGPVQLISSACAASTQALAMAELWIKTGRVKRCLVGGTELLSLLTVRGFNCFQLLSESIAKPFDEHRQGINLSEGSAFICLDSTVKPEDAMACLSGGGISSDAYHMTAPDPEGHGCCRAMDMALKGAGLDKSDIDWVHAHGTGSPHNDVAEGHAVFKMFGDAPVVSSSKAIHGHPLAVAGVMESILCIKAMQEQIILGTSNLEGLDPNIKASVIKDHLKKDFKHVIKNTLGFGGSNGSVIFSRPDAVEGR